MSNGEITLKDAKGAPTGKELHRYTVELRRRVETRESGTVTIITATPPEGMEKKWEEVWEEVSNREMLDEDDFEDSRHQEEIEKHETFNVRCKKTKEMDL